MNKEKRAMLTAKHIKSDLMAGTVVFLVALPLCLGIAVASGASPFAGIITGIIGGIVVGLLSKSHVSVTGPAAGLITIVLEAVTDLGYPAFLAAVVIAGAIQLTLGLAKTGGISIYFPSSVTEGMLVGIGIIIIKKEIPHAMGYDKGHQGDFFSYRLIEKDKGFLTELLQSFSFAHTGALIMAALSICVLIAFNKVHALKRIKAVPEVLVAVVAGILLNELFKSSAPALAVTGEQLVSLPVAGSFNGFIGQFTLPDVSSLARPGVWVAGLTIAVVASIESLHCLEAGDKMDPQRCLSSANAELRAQGIGNILSGIAGGLPMTSVIARTTANINAGARTKLAAVIHGIFLLVAAVVIPGLINRIPKASLAAILIMIGIKLASPSVIRQMWEKGRAQFIPFLVTVVVAVTTDLLIGLAAGLMFSIYYILKGNMKLAYFFKKEEYHEGDTIHIDLAQEVSFLNKAAIKQTLAHMPADSRVVIDASDTVYIDHDVLEIIRDFVGYSSKAKNIKVELRNFKASYRMENSAHVHSEKD
jgi:MFS superfamily sulfate permease-like transporter